MRIACVLKKLQDIAAEACRSEANALALYATVDRLLAWLEHQHRTHGMRGTFGERYASIRVSMEYLAGLRGPLGRSRDEIASTIRQDARVLEMTTLFGQRPDLMDVDLIE